ncbi:MAG: hypothetical protein ACRD3Y_07575 [Bryobacteraceae bacterium]
MSGRPQPLYKEESGLSGSLQPVAHEIVHKRFLQLLARERDTGLSIPWKEALLEPANPLKPNRRPAPKLPVLIALWIAGLGAGSFLWFSFFQ